MELNFIHVFLLKCNFAFIVFQLSIASFKIREGQFKRENSYFM
jgi:hypothetical protein